MRKAPNRPKHDITQPFNSGIVKIYNVEDMAPPGLAPVAGLSLKALQRYEERRLGVMRDYLSKQNQVKVEKVIRTPFLDNVSTQDVAVTEDGRQYRIDTKQLADVYPKSMDLALVAVVQKYEVPE